MHTPSLADYVDCLDRDDREGVAALMLASADKLARSGADFLICPDNTIHQAFDAMVGRSPLPWLHIADVVADEARARGYRRLALTGTKWLVESDVYPAKLAARGLDCVRPAPSEIDEIDRLIMDELVHGRTPPEAAARFGEIIEGFGRDGCDAVILGCTELPLIVEEATARLPTLDSTRLLARAALRRAVDGLQARPGGQSGRL